MGIPELLEAEKARFAERTPRSLELARRAGRVMPGAVPNDVYSLAPYPVAIVSGSGPRITDYDGNSYVDYSLGFGVSVWGHGNPDIARAIARRSADGSHFGALGEEVTEWAELLVERFRGDWVRFSNSGTEATMDALRIARAHTGRIKVAKMNGSYHGSHEIALVNANYPPPEEGVGYRPWGGGLSPRLRDEVVALDFNDLEAAEAALAGEDVAALIIEPVMFNVGAIWPEDGYLAGLREICTRTGTVLVFDETKTGHTIAWGGAESLFGVRPDIKTVGKGIGGGLPCGAIIGAEDWGYEMLSYGEVPHLGTFSGNPVVAAAGRQAMLHLDRSAYVSLERHRRLLVQGAKQAIREFELFAYPIGAGAKNCIVWADPKQGRLQDFNDYSTRFDSEMANLAWYWMVNRGIWLAQGQDEQTTHGTAHTDADAACFVEAFTSLGRQVADLRSRPGR